MTKEKSIIELARMTEAEAREMLERIRWGNEPFCPHCGDVNVTEMHGDIHRAGLFQCNSSGCRGQFTVTTGTVMHRSRLSLVKWILAFHMMCSSKKGVSALQLKRQLGIGSYQTAWHLCHRIRLAMKKGDFGKFGQNGGVVEADETYTGGKPSKKPGMSHTGRATKKIPVLTLIDRKSGAAHSVPIPKVSKDNVEPIMKEHIDQSATICTDDEKSYIWADKHFAGGRFYTKHSRGEYARDETMKDGTPFKAHSNTAESFYALLKRGFVGSFHRWSPQHLSRYCAEFDFRWTHRKASDFERTLLAIQGIEGKRLTYKCLPTGSSYQ